MASYRPETAILVLFSHHDLDGAPLERVRPYRPRTRAYSSLTVQQSTRNAAEERGRHTPSDSPNVDARTASDRGKVIERITVYCPSDRTDLTSSAQLPPRRSVETHGHRQRLTGPRLTRRPRAPSSTPLPIDPATALGSLTGAVIESEETEVDDRPPAPLTRIRAPRGALRRGPRRPPDRDRVRGSRCQSPSSPPRERA